MSLAEIDLAPPPPVRPAAVNYGFSGAAADDRACALAIRRGSKSFHLASLLLPAPTRRAALALYAFCRQSDDLVDAPGDRAPALAGLRQRLDRIYAGDPDRHPCDRAFARTVHAHAIPKAVASALLDGFAMDLAGQRYETLDELKTYAGRVAATVGLMMTLVMGRGGPDALARAADLGLAMQLTNIARDVGEDARAGRLYLPLDWLRSEGVDPHAFLAAPAPSPGLARVIARLLAAADEFYRRGLAGTALLPADCRPAIRTAALVYRQIGVRVARSGHDSVTRRATTPLGEKLALALAARRAGDGGAELVCLPPDPAVAELVAAASRAGAHLDRIRERHDGASARGGATSLDRFTEILIDLETRTRSAHGARMRGKAASLG